MQRAVQLHKAQRGERENMVIDVTNSCPKVNDITVVHVVLLFLLFSRRRRNNNITILFW